MILDDIGFYTLSEKRAMDVASKSGTDLQRCELILTDRCNFKCAYCRGVRSDLKGDLTLDQAKHVVDLWASGNLHNIRFSGGEPTIWDGLLDLVKYTKTKESIEHIALSTNGSADLSFYMELAEAGVNDFSISLDACCAMSADMMAGTDAKFDHIAEVIRELSKVTYVTVGVVLDERNNADLEKIISFATELGVSDIRIIPSAQSNHRLGANIETNYPILKYRLDNIKAGEHVRGLRINDSPCCHLVLDDMVILKDKHFPCVIYMREQGKEIGSIEGKNLAQIRFERIIWAVKTNTFCDPICVKNCLDVCRDYNNKVSEYARCNAIYRSIGNDFSGSL